MCSSLAVELVERLPTATAAAEVKRLPQEALLFIRKTNTPLKSAQEESRELLAVIRLDLAIPRKAAHLPKVDQAAAVLAIRIAARVVLTARMA